MNSFNRDMHIPKKKRKKQVKKYSKDNNIHDENNCAREIMKLIEEMKLVDKKQTCSYLLPS